jgi:DNA-directed RNA polymerase specialized sigma24 family protein
MISERRAPGKRARRRIELPCADLDRIDATAGLWADAGEGSGVSRRAALVCDAVRRAVATALTEKQREVIEAHFFEGLSQGAIAIRLGITQQVVHKRIYGAPRGGRVVGGAIQKLREALGPFVLSRATDSFVNRANTPHEEAFYEH